MACSDGSDDGSDGSDGSDIRKAVLCRRLFWCSALEFAALVFLFADFVLVL